MTIRRRLQSFKYAGKGFTHLASCERNFQIHLCAAIIAILLGFVLEISANEWCIIIICIGSVFCSEALNTAIELLADRITTNRDHLIGKAKDVAAAGVTFTAVASLAVGLIIFLPKLIGIFYR